MKSINLILGAAIVAILAGCSSTPVLLAPVGPRPIGRAIRGETGRLQVFSAFEAHSDSGNQGGDEPIYYQHTHYYIYSPQGKLLKHVNNTEGHYDDVPTLVPLPAGTYTVNARGEGYDWVVVPVVIESGRTTVVHLDKGWKPPASTPETELVSMPGGYPVGWSARTIPPSEGH